MDYSKLSDAELRAALAQGPAQAPGTAPDYSSLSNEELLALIQSHKPKEPPAGRGGVLASAAEAFLTGLTDVPAGIAAIYTPDSQNTRAAQFSAGAREAIQSALGINPEAAPTTAELGAQAIGSLGSFFVPGLGAARGAKLLGAEAKAAELAGKIATGVQAGSLGALQQQQSMEASGKNIDPETRRTAILGGAAIGLTDLLTLNKFMGPLEKILARVPLTKAETAARTVEQSVKRALLAATEEGAQEALSQGAQNIVEQGLYNPDLDITEGILSNGGAGGFAGGTMDVILQLLAGRKRSNFRQARGQLAESAYGEAKAGSEEAIRAEGMQGLNALRAAAPIGNLSVQRVKTLLDDGKTRVEFHVVGEDSKPIATFSTPDSAVLAAQQYEKDAAGLVKFNAPTAGDMVGESAIEGTSSEEKTAGRQIAQEMEDAGDFEPSPATTPTTPEGQAATEATVQNVAQETGLAPAEVTSPTKPKKGRIRAALEVAPPAAEQPLAAPPEASQAPVIPALKPKVGTPAPTATAAPTFEDVRSALPKDADGAPDLAVLEKAVTEVKGQPTPWAQLTDGEKASALAKVSAQTKKVITPQGTEDIMAEIKPAPIEQTAQSMFQPRVQALFRPSETTPEGIAGAKAFDERQAAIVSEVNKAIAPIGLKNVRVKFENFLKEKTRTGQEVFPQGFVNEAGDVITLATNIYDPSLTPEQIAQKVVEIMNHEVIHSLVNLGLFKPGEVKTLFDAVQRTKYPGAKFTYFDRAMNTYGKVYTKADGTPNMEMIVEEGVAEMFRDWNAGRLKLAGKPEGLFQRMLEFLKRIFRGFKAAKVDDVFRAIKAGEMGAREGKPAEAGGTKFALPAQLTGESEQEFSRWFRQSVAVNEDGSPKIFYHGRPRPLREGQFNRAGSGALPGEEGPYFFSPSSQFADNFAMANLYKGGDKKSSKTGAMYPVYLSVQKPWDYNVASNVDDVIDYISNGLDSGKISKEEVSLLRRGKPEITSLKQIGIYLEAGDWDAVELPAVQRAIRDLGFDGFYLVETDPEGNTARNLAVYKPEQIKSIFNQFEPGTAESKKLAIAPQFTVDNPSYVPERNAKGSVIKYITNGMDSSNSAQAFARLDAASRAVPNPAASPQAWMDRISFAYNSGEKIIIPPEWLIGMTNDVPRWSSWLRLAPNQLATVDQGFQLVDQLNNAYRTGVATPETTANLFMWVYMSRMASAFPHEAGYLDMAQRSAGFLQKAINGTFTSDPALVAMTSTGTAAKQAKANAGFPENALPADVAVPGRSDLDDWFLMIRDALPDSSPGNAVTNNMNSFGRDFLGAMSRPAPNSNRTRLEVLHEALVGDKSGRDVRRTFHALRDGDSVGFDNKILSFALLLAGKQDVVVLDRIQINQLFGGGQTNKIYDLVASGFNGPRGLAIYEALEDAINLKIAELYDRLGRPADGTVGRLHWESWIRSSGQEVAHPTIQALVNVAYGRPNPFSNIPAREGRFHRSMFGVQYIRRPNGAHEFVYTTRAGGEFAFDKSQIDEILNGANMRKEGITPKWFPGVSDFEGGTTSWRDYPGVDVSKLERIIAQKGKALNNEARQQKSAVRSRSPQAANAAGLGGGTSSPATAANRVRWELGRRPVGGSNKARVPDSFVRTNRGIADGNVIQEYALKPEAERIFKDANVSTFAIQELAPTEDNAKRFRDAISDSKANAKHGAAVYVYDLADYAKMRLFLTQDGLTGFALKGDDIVSVFNNPKSGRRAASVSLLHLAIQEGGRKLDCFDTVLPNLYAQVGMTAVSRLKFSDNQKPSDWNEANFVEYNGGRPDAVYMVFDPASWSLYKPTDGELVHTGTSEDQEYADYNAATKIQSDSVYKEPSEAPVKPVKPKPVKDQVVESAKATAVKMAETAKRNENNPQAVETAAIAANQAVKEAVKKMSITPVSAPMPASIAAVNDTLFAKETSTRTIGEKLMGMFGGLGTAAGRTNLMDQFRVNFVQKEGQFAKRERELAFSPKRAKFEQDFAEYSAVAALDMRNRASHYTVEVMQNGAPVVKMIDPATRTAVNAGQGGDINSMYLEVENDPENTPAKIFEILLKSGPNGTSLVEHFRSYATAQVAKKRLSEGKPLPKGITQQYINDCDQLGVTYPPIVEAFKRYQTFNAKLIKAAMDAGVIGQTSYQKFLNGMNYYSLYAQFEDEPIVPGTSSSVGSKIKIREYEGGGDGNLLADPIAAMMYNVAFWNNAILQNIASQKALRLGKDTGLMKQLNVFKNPNGTFSVEQPDTKAGYVDKIFYTSINGVPTPFATKDPLLAVGLMSNPQLNMGKMFELMGMPTGFLREMVTRDPGFMVANLLRDSVATWVLAGAGAKPHETFKGLNDAFQKKGSYEKLRNFGVIGSFDEAQKSPEKFVAGLRGKILKTNGLSDITGTLKKAWDGLERLSEASDAATRIAVYDAAKRSGQSDFTAAYRSLSIMNFSRSGASAGVRMYAKLVPFLNARIQGFDVLYTGLKAAYGTASGAEQTDFEKQRGTAVLFRGMGLMAAALALAALNDNDDDYKQLPQYIKDANILIPIGGGKFVSIPKPFEAGLLFMTIPTAAYETATGNRSVRSTTKLFMDQFSSTFGFNPVPQFALPFVENYVNRDFYTGLPLISAGQEKLSPELQYNASTSYVARGIGNLLGYTPLGYNSDTGRFEGASPIQIDNLISGYGGPIASYLGMAVGAVSTAFGTDNQGLPVAASNMPVIRRFFVDAQDKQPQAAAEAYELYQQVDKVNRTISRLKKMGDTEALKEYRAENIDILRVGKQVRRMADNLNNLRAQLRRLEADTKMSGQEKLAKMRELRSREITLTRKIDEINQKLGR